MSLDIQFKSMLMFQYTGDVMNNDLQITGTVLVNGGSYEMKNIVLPPELTSEIDQFMQMEALRRLGGENA